MALADWAVKLEQDALRLEAELQAVPLEGEAGKLAAEALAEVQSATRAVHHLRLHITGNS